MDNKAKNTNSSQSQRKIPTEEFVLDKDGLYQDKSFSRNLTSLTEKNIEWKRPKDISENPKFFVEGYDRFDVKQGELGDCWFLAALDTLTLYPNFFHEVVPNNQSFENGYNGTFNFKFYYNNTIKYIWIDDYLPTINNELIFAMSSEKNEFWSALLEKAYAKFLSTYPDACDEYKKKQINENKNNSPYLYLNGGLPENAIKNFIGEFNVDIEFIHTFNKLQDAYEQTKIISLAIGALEGIKKEKLKAAGLVDGHAYSLTRVKKLVLPEIIYLTVEEEDLKKDLNLNNIQLGDKTKMTLNEFCKSFDGPMFLFASDKKIEPLFACKQDFYKKIQGVKNEYITHYLKESCLEEIGYPTSNIKPIYLSNTSDFFEKLKKYPIIYDICNKDYKIIIDFPTTSQSLVRIRNPWGENTEWNRKWSDGSKEWKKVFDDDKDNVRFVKRADGEFWMSYEDVQKYFSWSTISYKDNNQNETQNEDFKIKEKIETPKNTSALIDNKPKTTGTKTL